MPVIQFQHARGAATDVNTYTGLAGELVVDTTNKQVRVHDGVTTGGTAMAKEAEATQSVHGLMSVADKTKLDNIAAATAAPLALGIAAVGSSSKYAREDHVHPLPVAKKIDGVDFNGSSAIVHYGTCSTAAATAAKTVACTGFGLEEGSRITVLFTVTNTATSPTLNVNSTGAKAIWYNGAAINKNYLIAGKVYTFVYDGTRYRLENGDPAFDALVEQVETLADQLNTLITQMDTYFSGFTGYPRESNN